MRRAIVLLSVLALSLAGAALPVATSTAAAALCGSMVGTAPHVTKVLWIFMENTSYGAKSNQIPGSSSAPYIENTLMAQCGSTTSYHAVTHPSQPNYIAATSGGVQTVNGDKLGYYAVPNLFAQVDPSWRSYQEYMPNACDHSSQRGNPTDLNYYVGKHNPAASYSSLPVGAPTAGDCPGFDVPMGTTTTGALQADVQAGTLPTFAEVTPGLCNDMHLLPTGVAGCPNPTLAGDTWLSTWIPLITAGPDYQAGNLVIDVAWDEGRGGSAGDDCVARSTVDCLVPNLVISPYTPHVVSSTTFSHYSLLRTTEHLLGLPYLGHAADPGTADMCGDFGLCPGPATPTASFIASCDLLACSFDASQSSSPNGPITAWDWDFGDGTSGAGAGPQHTFARAGTYQVSLTVTDNLGAMGTVTSQVTVSDGTAPAISYIGSSSVTGGRTSQSVTVPAGTQSGDGLLLLATDASASPITGPAGWTLVGTGASTAMTTTVWSRVAAPGDSSLPVTVGFGGTFKDAVQLVAYHGTSATGPVASVASTTTHITSTTATTPGGTVALGSSWVLSYWSVKSSAVTAWTTPAGQTARSTAYGTGGGRISALLADTGGPVPAGPATGVAATADQPFGASTVWTIVLAPAP
jgi:PKD repeat protein